MELGAAIKAGFTKTFVYQGRASRSEFWFFQLFHVIVFVVLMMVLAVVLNLSANREGTISPVAGLSMLLVVIYLIGMLLPLISLAVRRLHDSDKSGAFLLLTFVPFGGLVLLVFYCLPGSIGPNKYGDDPLHPATAAARVF